jgi:hypothetical protein
LQNWSGPGLKVAPDGAIQPRLPQALTSSD